MPTTNKYNLSTKWSKTRQHQFFLSGQLRERVMTNPMNASFYVTAAGCFSKPNGYVCERCPNDDEYIFIYCCEGRGEVLIGEDKVILNAHNYLIIPAHVYCKCINQSATNWSVCWMFFSGTLAAELHNRAMQNNGKAAPLFTFNVRSVNHFLALCQSFSVYKTEMELEGINFRLLHFVTSLVYQPVFEGAFAGAAAVDEFIEFMEDNLGAKYGIKELASHHGVSVSTYSAAFKEKMSMSPIKFFNELKMLKACQLLMATDLTIKSISSKLGFDDPYYFSRVFTKINGSSPTRYRELSRVEAGVTLRHQVA